MDEMKKWKKGDYFIVPNRKALRELSTVEKAIFVSICDYANEDGLCFPTRNTIGRDNDVSESTVDRAIKTLCEKGFIEKENRRNGEEYTSNIYQILVKRVASPMKPGPLTHEATPGVTHDDRTITSINDNYKKELEINSQSESPQDSIPSPVLKPHHQISNTPLPDETLEDDEPVYEETDEDGNVIPQKKKRGGSVSKNRLAMNIVTLFGDMCHRTMKTRPVADSKAYYVALNALKHLEPEQILALLKGWFSEGFPVEETIQITRALSHVNINKYKANHHI